MTAPSAVSRAVLLGFRGESRAELESHAAAVQEAEEFEAEREANPLPRVARALVERETALANVARYEATLENRLFRTLHELQRLQAARAGRPIAPPLAVDLTVSGDTGREPPNEPRLPGMLDVSV